MGQTQFGIILQERAKDVYNQIEFKDNPFCKVSQAERKKKRKKRH